MASLDREDRLWFEDQITGLRSDVAGLRTDFALGRQEMMAHITSDSCRKIRAHEAGKHDLCKDVAKFVGLLGGSVGALVGLKSLGLF